MARGCGASALGMRCHRGRPYVLTARRRLNLAAGGRACGPASWSPHTHGGAAAAAIGCLARHPAPHLVLQLLHGGSGGRHQPIHAPRVRRTAGGERPSWRRPGGCSYGDLHRPDATAQARRWGSRRRRGAAAARRHQDRRRRRCDGRALRRGREQDGLPRLPRRHAHPLRRCDCAGCRRAPAGSHRRHVCSGCRRWGR